MVHTNPKEVTVTLAMVCHQIYKKMQLLFDKVQVQYGYLLWSRQSCARFPGAELWKCADSPKE
jgi:hypothetical protein